VPSDDVADGLPQQLSDGCRVGPDAAELPADRLALRHRQVKELHCDVTLADLGAHEIGRVRVRGEEGDGTAARRPGAFLRDQSLRDEIVDDVGDAAGGQLETGAEDRAAERARVHQFFQEPGAIGPPEMLDGGRHGLFPYDVR